MTSSGHLSLAESASSSALRELGNGSSRRRATIPPTLADTDEGFRRSQHQAVGHMRLFVNGVAADVSLEANGLRWAPSFEDNGGGLASDASTSNTFGNGQGLFFCFPMLEASAVHTIPFKEMLCAERLVQNRNLGVVNFLNFLQTAVATATATPTTTTNTSSSSTEIAKPTLYGFSIHTFKRSPSKPSEWHPWQLDIESESEEVIETLLSEISTGISAVAASRPRRVLLILNPNAGSGAARAHYRNILQPLLSKAGISAQVVETERAGHAKHLVLEAFRIPPPTDDVEYQNKNLEKNEYELEYDGILAVGGDGIFHEIINGLLEAQNQSPPDGEHNHSLLSSLRLAHIPCGSTDAVACSLHGCRSVFTAAMHMALGDSTSLDALKVCVGGTVRYACCIATYGFMGDVVQESEKHRWLGPLRYDIIGAMKIVNNQSYACRIKYIPAPRIAAAGAAPAGNKNHNTTNQVLNHDEEEEMEEIVQSICVENCTICRAASIASSTSQKDLKVKSASTAPAATATTTGINSVEIEDSDSTWRVLEGEWMSIMLIVQPCRSDKTPHGMARYGHLNDGRFTLVLVRRCSPFNYLRFLATMSSSGLAPGMMPGVLEVYDAVACKVESISGTEYSNVTSHWNIDGEIVQGVDMEAHAQLGAVRCFARGVET